MHAEPLSLFRDARGLVFEPVDAAELSAQRNVHVVLTAPGAVRGNHYHREKTEVLAVVGPALVRVREDGELVDVRVQDGEVYRFVFPPGMAHAVQNTGHAPNVQVAFTTAVHDPEDPDTYRDVLITPAA